MFKCSKPADNLLAAPFQSSVSSKRGRFFCTKLALLLTSMAACGQDVVVPSGAVDEAATESVIIMDEKPAVDTTIQLPPGVVMPAPGAQMMPPGQSLPPGVVPGAVPPPGTPVPGSPSVSPPGAAGSTSPVQRPKAKEFVPLPIDQQIRTNPDGLVTFSLVGQPWDVVMQWIADASALSLDWQELPGDALNLTTTREYKLPEARDLLNRHLLSRGYTMVLNGEVLSVVKVAQLNPSLVPRVRPEELGSLPEHTMCKISFDLQWLIADEAVEELKPMLSSAGQIHKLSRTNRLEVIDTAASLRDIWEILQSEQSDDGHEQLVRAFHLKHRRAEEVIRMLRDLLGLQDTGMPAASGAMDPNMMQQQMMQMQQQMQMQMQAAAAQAGQPGGQPRKKIETRLVLNHRENMILAQASPDQMAVIEQSILQVDVPADNGNSLLQNINRMKIYRLETVDPQTLHDLLQQLGDLDPGTVLKVDKKTKAIIAWASLADHLTITTLVERLDQSARTFEVIPLRRLEAEYVAGTIRALMAPPAEENSNQQNPFGYINFGFPMQSQQEPPDRGFRVDADLENNRLLVYANTVEMEEILNLLRKLGELPDPNAPEGNIRVFDLSPSEDLPELQRRLEQLWHRKNPLEFSLPKQLPKDDDAEKPEEAGAERIQLREDMTRSEVDFHDLGNPGHRKFESLLRSADQSATSDPNRSESVISTVTSLPEPDTSEDRQEPVLRSQEPIDAEDNEESAPPLRNPMPQSEPPVRLSVGPDGRMIVTSDDPNALADIEELLSQLSRSKKNYRVFRLKYATPSWITITLRDYFKAEEQTESTMSYDPFFGMVPSKKKVKGNHSLSRRRQPQFISDNFTSTILVRDADPQQLKIIEELIELYDVPEPADTRSMRMTTMYRLKHAKAASVAAAVKDVFRDLLSSNDKALNSGDKNERPSGGGGFVTFMPGGASDDSDDSEDEPIRFKGLLSIGVDESSNTLIVSSTASLMETIGEMIEQLDDAAMSSSVVEVIKMDPTVDIELLQEKLNNILNPQIKPSNTPGNPMIPGQPPGFPGQPAPGAEIGGQPSVIVN